MKRWFDKDFDRDGRKAAEGKVCEQLLERLVEDQYIRRPPPKSTGREVQFNGHTLNVCFFFVNMEVSQ